MRDGAGRLTLDAVARESATSKGGVLYHFGTKEALITGMLDALIATFERSMEDWLARGAHARRRGGEWMRAYINASLEEEQYSVEVLAGLAAALATNPELLGPLRQRYEVWQQNVASDGIDAVDATIVRLAVDGLWFADLFGLAPPRAAFRRRVVSAMLAMTQRKESAN